MQRKWLVPLILSAALLLLAVMPNPSAEKTCRAFLSKQGFEIAENFSAEEVILPRENDPAWKSYLHLQRENGFSMEAYCGSTVLKLTFTILNYPEEDTIYANLYWSDGQIIGGDIMSPAVDGFMHGLYIDLL